MKEDQLTPWFPAEVKPVHVGPYPTKTPGTSTDGFSWWDGNEWGLQYEFLSNCVKYKTHMGFLRSNQVKIWRGLRSKP